MPPLLHVVLYQPEIPQNTGNIGRSCVAVGAKLWLVRPLGFEMDSRHLKRAGMDYWDLVDCEVVDSWEHLLERLAESAHVGGAGSAVDSGSDSAARREPRPPGTRPPGGLDPTPRFWLLTKFANKLVWEASFQPGDVLVFGSESRGLPERLRREHADNCLKLPMLDDVRSLNLASTANTVMYEAVRQFGGLG